MLSTELYEILSLFTNDICYEDTSIAVEISELLTKINKPNPQLTEKQWYLLSHLLVAVIELLQKSSLLTENSEQLTFIENTLLDAQRLSQLIALNTSPDH